MQFASPIARIGLLWMLLGGTLLFSAEPTVRLEMPKFAWGGHLRHGRGAEVKLTIHASAACSVQVELFSRDGDGVPVIYAASGPTKLVPAENDISLPWKVGPPRAGFGVRILDKDRTLLEQSWSEQELGKFHGSLTECIAVRDVEAIGGLAALDWLKKNHPREIVPIEIKSKDEFPLTTAGYEAIDRLWVVGGSEPPLHDLEPIQQAALLEWLRGGGKLLVAFTAGFHSENLPINQQMLGLSLGVPQSARPLSTETGLKTFASEPLPFDLEKINEKPFIFPMQMPRSQVLQWESGSSTDDVPLLTVTPYGAGTITCVWLDLSHARMREWVGRTRFWTRVLYGRDWENLAEQASRGSGGQASHRGYTELIGQLRAALDQYRHVTPVHFYSVAGALLVYLLLLGPGEYLLLRKFSPQMMHLTWWILPCLVGGMVWGGMHLGQLSHGTQMRVNRLELLDLYAESGAQRGQAWLGVFSPQSQTLNLQIQPRELGLNDSRVQSCTAEWLALPGEGLGGVDAPSLAMNMPHAYRLSHTNGATAAQLSQVPVAAASSKLLSCSWRGTFATSEGASQLHRGKIKDLEGTFRCLAPVTLKNAYLAHGEWLYRATDEIQPGATVSVDRLERRHLEYHLTQRKVLASSDLATPWNPDDTDPQRILEILMFHTAVGGEHYTVLSNHAQSQLDLSHLLKSGFAVLVGRVEAPLLECTHQETPLAAETTERWSFVRIIYPVAEAPKEREP